MRRLSTNRELRSTLGANAQTLWANQFRLETMVEGYQRVIAEALTTGPRHDTSSVQLPAHLRATGIEHAESLVREILGPEYISAMPIEEKGSAEEIARLNTERSEADRRYNEALTKLDAAIQKPREMPPPPPPYDEFQITPLNERWELLPLKPDEGGGWLRARCAPTPGRWSRRCSSGSRRSTRRSSITSTATSPCTGRRRGRLRSDAVSMLRDDHQTRSSNFRRC